MSETEMTKHIPVLLEETLKHLALKPGMVVIDATLGGGGHAIRMLEQVLPNGKVIAFDTDAEAIARFENSITLPWVKDALKNGHLILREANYSALGEALDELGITEADAILADLGFSSDQIEAPERGFSFLKEGPLDMRLNRKERLTAADIVNTYSREELQNILRIYGEEAEARAIAKAIVQFRKTEPLKTTTQLATLIDNVFPKWKRARMKIHPATKTFQALRIAVNQEYEHLEKFLDEAILHLKEGGRLVLLTFHSGEDRIVKRFFRAEAKGCVCPPNFPICRCGKTPRLKILTHRPETASEDELGKNVRARSAKLRAGARI